MKDPFLDERLSDTARGLFMTFCSDYLLNFFSIDDLKEKENKLALQELIDCGYIDEGIKKALGI